MANPELRLWGTAHLRGRYDDYDNIPSIHLLQDDSLIGKKNNCDYPPCRTYYDILNYFPGLALNFLPPPPPKGGVLANV